MKYFICKNCKWKMEGNPKDIWRYCKINKRLGINPMVIDQNPKDKPVKNINIIHAQVSVRDKLLALMR